MKSLLIAVSVLALTSGAAFAQGAQSPAMPAAPSTGNSSGTAGHSWGTHGATAEHSSYKVRQAQQALKHDGLYKGRIDGINGPQTRSAVAQFQKQHGLKQTAQLDPKTMQKLEKQSGSMPGAGSNMSGGGGNMSGGGNAPANNSHY
jgi:peptidoglycan hydrolase-like protein with peptidoglycan-binding domain